MERVTMRIVAMVALVVAVVPPPSMASGTPAFDATTWMSRDSLRDPPAEALAGALAAHDDAGIEEARKRMLTGSQVVGGSEMTAASDVACVLECEPVPAGDLNGDGDDDMIVVEKRTTGFSAPPTYAMTARHVSDGTVMWERSFARSTLYFDVAPTIRGFEGDLIVMEYEVRQGVNDSVVRRIDGATGDDVWTRRFPGLGVGTNLLVELNLVPATEAHGAAVMAGFVDGWLLTSVTYTGRLLSAASGADLGEATAVGTVGPDVGFYRLPRVAALPSADARGRLGLVAISQNHNRRVAIATAAGDPVPLWVSSLQPPGEDPAVVWRPFTNLVSDFDGDGISDVLVTAYAYFGFPFDRCAGAFCTAFLSTSSVMLAGSSGVEAWSRFVPFGFPVATVPVAARADVHVVAFPSDFTVETFAVNGITGGPSPRATYTAPVPGGSSGYAVACVIGCIADVNGDGAVDVLVTFAGNLPNGDAATPPIVALSGAGGVLWSRNRTTAALPGPARGDADGDGLSDLFVMSWSVDEAGELTLAVQVVSGARGADLWSATVPIERRRDSPIDLIFDSTVFASRAEGKPMLVVAVLVADEDFYVYGRMAVADAAGVRWRL